MNDRLNVRIWDNLQGNFVMSWDTQTEGAWIQFLLNDHNVFPNITWKELGCNCDPTSGIVCGGCADRYEDASLAEYSNGQKRFIVEWACGKRDVNHKIIYNGDKVESTFNKKKFIIYYSDKEYMWKIKTYPQIWLGKQYDVVEDYALSKYNSFGKFKNGMKPLDYLKVIGNIHEENNDK